MMIDHDFSCHKIAEAMRPPEALARVLILASKVVPKAKLVPTVALDELAFRDPSKRKMVSFITRSDSRAESFLNS